MKKRLEVEVQQVEQVTLVTMKGMINEDNNLKEVAAQIATPKVVINTAQVDLINSLGVRDWVKWIAALERRGVASYFVECSPPIMTQANLVINFIGSGKILSFHAPYSCPACGQDQPTLLSIDQVLHEGGAEAPTRRCIHCDHLLDFLERESFYFSFLSWSEAGAADPEIEEALRIASQPPPSAPVKTLEDHLLPETLSSPEPLRVRDSASARRGIHPLIWVILAVMVATIGILVYILARRGS